MLTPSRKIRFTAFDLPLAVFLLSACLGVLPAYDRSLVWVPLGALLGGGCLYLVISRGVRSCGLLRIARLGVVGSGLAGLFFITQVAHYQPAEKIELIGRLAEWFSWPFPTLTFWQPFPNSMAFFLEEMLFLSFGLLLSEKARGWRITAAVSTGVIALALLLSMSRGAWLAIGIAGLLWLALYWRPARWGLALFGAGTVILLLIVLVTRDIYILDRIPVINQTLAPLFIRPDRLDVYQGSLALIEDMPFTGIGLGGQFAMQYSRYVLLIQVPFLTYSHNLYLEAWLEQGIIGVLALVWLGIALVWIARRQLAHSHNFLIEGAWFGLAAFYLHGLTDARPYVDVWCWLPFFFLLGLSSAALLQQPENVSARARPRAMLLAGVGGLACILLVLFLSISTIEFNLASLNQARADLDPRLTNARRDELKQDATDGFIHSIALKQNNPTAHLRLGLIYSENEMFSSAVTELEAAHRIDPTNLTAIKALGLAYAWNGEVEKASAMLTDVPEIVEELNNWGWWWGSNADIDQARYAYQVSLLLDADQPEVREVLDGLIDQP